MRQPPGKRNCRNCYFARLIADRLHCVKNEPAIDYETGCARWPAVKDDDICGKFRCAAENHIDADHWPKNDLKIYTDRFGDYCKIPLTQARFAKVDPEDYIWLSQFRWHCKVNKNAIYAVRNINHAGKSKRIFMHRLLMDTPPHLVCDHVNHDAPTTAKPISATALSRRTMQIRVPPAEPHRNTKVSPGTSAAESGPYT